jgi:PLD-like domain
MLTFLNCPPNPTFKETFERCCNEYERLFFASAYCTWPRVSLQHLQRLNSITAVLAPIEDGKQDDPRTGFKELAIAMKDDGRTVHVHEFREPQLFHPKLYVFRRGDEDRALIIGSSNFTRAAFESNEELDVLLEGKIAGTQFDSLRQRINDWFSSGTCLTKQCPSK